MMNAESDPCELSVCQWIFLAELLSKVVFLLLNLVLSPCELYIVVSLHTLKLTWEPGLASLTCYSVELRQCFVLSR